MKATIYMATYNKNDVLPNTLYSIARQEVSFPYEVCIIDDHSDVDPEPIIRKFIPDAKYKRFDNQQGFDVVTAHALDMASDDADILIMQSADVMHYSKDSIERLCNGVAKKVICMAEVHNTHPPVDMYKDFEKQLPKILFQWQAGEVRSRPGKYYFFLGAIKRADYESLSCVKKPHCDVILKDELKKAGIKENYPPGLIGFHQHHSTSTIPCTSLGTCKHKVCSLRRRCNKLGWTKIEDYLAWKEENQK